MTMSVRSCVSPYMKPSMCMSMVISSGATK